MNEKTFKITNQESGKDLGLERKDAVLGPSVVDITALYREQGVFTYDPGFGATACCSSTITYIDGEQGVLMYRGYPIEQLAAHSTYIEVAYLLMYGELPTQEELTGFDQSIRNHTMLNESFLRFFNGFDHDAHPMAMVSGIVACMSAFYHDSTDIQDAAHREVSVSYTHLTLPTKREV